MTEEPRVIIGQDGLHRVHKVRKSDSGQISSYDKDPLTTDAHRHPADLWELVEHREALKKPILDVREGRIWHQS